MADQKTASAAKVILQYADVVRERKAARLDGRTPSLDRQIVLAARDVSVTALDVLDILQDTGLTADEAQAAFDAVLEVRDDGIVSVRKTPATACPDCNQRPHAGEPCASRPRRFLDADNRVVTYADGVKRFV